MNFPFSVFISHFSLCPVHKEKVVFKVTMFMRNSECMMGQVSCTLHVVSCREILADFEYKPDISQLDILSNSRPVLTFIPARVRSSLASQTFPFHSADRFQYIRLSIPKMDHRCGTEGIYPLGQLY